MKIQDFLTKYELLASSSDFNNVFTQYGKKTCKFCKRSSEETTFNSKPHVIPELFGKNNFVSNDECDHCNSLFGRFETSLANYISPYQTLVGQKTKNKIPKFQSRKIGIEKSNIITNIKGDLNFQFGNNLSDFSYNYTDKILSVKLKRKKFNPIHVYKGLVKIGMSLCPLQEILSYQNTLIWLRENEEEDNQSITYDIPLTLFRTRFSNKKFSSPSASLYKRINTSSNNIYRPHLCLIVYSGILVFQIFIPFYQETESIDPSQFSLEQTIFPAFVLDTKLVVGKENVSIDFPNLNLHQYDMNYNKQVEEDEWISFSYQELIRMV